MGWRYLLLTLGLLSLLIFCLRFIVFTFRETPKYCIYKEQDKKAIQTIQHMAKINKQKCKLNIGMLEALERYHVSNGNDPRSQPMLQDESTQRHIKQPSPVSSQNASANRKAKRLNKANAELSRYKMLFDGFQMTRLTILIWLTYAMDFWGFTVAGMYPLYRHNPT